MAKARNLLSLIIAGAAIFGDCKYSLSQTACAERWQKYLPIVYENANRRAIDPGILMAQLEIESGFNPRAVSPSGALGIAQVMPNTAKELGYKSREMFIPQRSIEAQARYMEMMIEMPLIDSLIDENEINRLALASYNAGYGNIRHAIRIVRAANRGEKKYNIFRGYKYLKDRRGKYVKDKKGKKIVVRDIRIIDISKFGKHAETWEEGFSKALVLVTGEENSKQTINYVRDIMKNSNKYLPHIQTYGQYKELYGRPDVNS